MNETCPYDGGQILIVHSSRIYGEGSKDYGLMKMCENYPRCDAYCGYRASVANAELRELRQECHARFDSVWKQGYMTRSQAYMRLGRKMKLSPKQAHISLFGVEECKKLLSMFKKAPINNFL